MGGERPYAILFAWMGWWRIDHWTVTRINYVLTPIILTGASIGVNYLPKALNLFGCNGFLNQTNGLLQTLVGFFIAALAAVATFQRDGMDDPMGGDPPRLSRGHGRKIEALTRRRFLCILFGYLSGVSILLYLLGVFAVTLSPSLSQIRIEMPLIHMLLRSLSFGIYFSLFTHMIVTSYLGLYFLIDRFHRQNHPLGFVDANAPAKQGQVEPPR